MATAILIVPGAQAVGVSKPFLYNQGGQDPQYSPGVTVVVSFNDPDLVSLAGLVLHFDCSASGTFSESMGLTEGSASRHAILVDVVANAHEGYGYNQGTQTGYGYTSGQHGGYTGNTDLVDFGGYGYNSDNGYSYGYDSGYGYGYDSGTLTFSFEWVQGEFIAYEECYLVLEVVPKGRTTGDFESPRSDKFIPRVPPEANAGPDRVGVPGHAVTFDGSGSFDLNDGPEPLVYAWAQESGPLVTGLTGISTDTLHFIAPDALDQVITFNLTVSDGLDTDWDLVDVAIRLVAAPADDTRLEGVTIPLVATIADVQGLTLQWTVMSGPPAVFGDAADGDTVVTLPEVDVPTPVVMRITATQGTTVRWDEVTITVLDNEAPVVDAGAEIGLVSGVATLLEGADVTDDEDDVPTLKWTQTAGPLVGFDDDTVLEPTIMAPVVTSTTAAVLVLTADDGHGAIGKDVRRLIISPPVAPNAGSDQGVLEGTPVTLTAAAATTYAWTVPNGIVPTSAVNAAVLTFTAPQVTGAPQSFTFGLQVDGQAATDQVTVTVHDAPTGSPADWYLHTDGCLLADVAGLPLDPEDTADHVPGDQSACLRPALPIVGGAVDFATSSAGAIPQGTAVTGTLYLSILVPATSEPILSLPGFDAVPIDIDVLVGGQVVGHQHVDADVETLLFDLDPTGLVGLPDLPIGFTAVTVPSFTVSGVPAQSAFTFRVTIGTTIPDLVYAIGVETGAASVFHVADVGASSSAPIAVASGASAAEGSSVQLSSSGSVGAAPLAYSWVQTSGPVVAFNAAVAQPTFTAPPVLADTTATFVLTVRDAAGRTAQDDVTLTFSNVPFVNHAPVASAGPDFTVPAGQFVTVTGGMSDADGDFTFGRWTQSGTPLVGGSATGPAGGSRAVRSFTVPDVEDGTTFTLVWTVRDNHGTLPDSIDQVTITVGSGGNGQQPIPEPPQPPQPGPGEPQPPGTSSPPPTQPTQPAPGQPQQPTPQPTPGDDAELDSDGDGIPDRIELLLGSDPFDARSLPSFDITQLLTVKRVNGINELSWRGLSVAAGYQLWSSNSPYVLLSTVEGAGNTTFSDHSGTGKETTKYKLTFFIEKTKAGGYLADASQVDSLPGWDASSGTSSLSGKVVQAAKDIPLWTYLILVAMAGIVLVAITYYARFERPKK